MVAVVVMKEVKEVVAVVLVDTEQMFPHPLVLETTLLLQNLQLLLDPQHIQ